MTEPQIRTAGVDGLLVSFGTRLSEPANRAALAFRDAVDRAGWDGLCETATSLVSTYLRFDPLHLSHAELRSRISTLLAERDWHAAPLPEGRRLWRVPTVFGGASGPELEDAAMAAGMSVQDAVSSISEAVVRVQTIGFAPGMPYLGELPEAWNIPRQQALTDQVPAGGLCVAIRQLVLFPVATPTGWRQIGQTRFQLFRPDAETPFVLRPGDEVCFTAVSQEELDQHADDPDGSATSETIA